MFLYTVLLDFIFSHQFRTEKTSKHGITNLSKNRGLAWGSGFMINPIESIAIKVGYEGAKTSLRKKDEILKAFNIGIGYRF